MARHRYTAEEIIHKLREADVVLGQGKEGKTIARACGSTLATRAFALTPLTVP